MRRKNEIIKERNNRGGKRKRKRWEEEEGKGKEWGRHTRKIIRLQN